MEAITYTDKFNVDFNRLVCPFDPNHSGLSPGRYNIHVGKCARRTGKKVYGCDRCLYHKFNNPYDLENHVCFIN